MPIPGEYQPNSADTRPDFFDRYIATPRGVLTLAVGTLAAGAYTVNEFANDRLHAGSVASTVFTIVGAGLTWAAAYFEYWNGNTAGQQPQPPIAPQ